MEQTLFQPEEQKPTLTCKSCKHRQRWECNSKVFQYCGVRKSNRTDNGLLKIKCKDKACPMYETVQMEHTAFIQAAKELLALNKGK